MPSELLRQDDFSGGEVAELSYGRTKSPAYQHGLRLALNYLPLLDGPLVNRPGTRYVAAVKDASFAPRLVTFSFSDGQTFVLEIGNLYIRFVQNGAQVLFAGVPYELVAPWATADLTRLDWAQNGDVITFTCRNGATQYPPYRLTRITNTNWTLVQVSTTPQAYFGGTQSVKAGDVAVSSAQTWALLLGLPSPAGSLVVFKPAADPTHFHLYQANVQTFSSPDAAPADWTDLSWNAATVYDKGKYVWDAASNNVFMSLVEQNLNNAVTVATAWVVATDSAHPAKAWQWALTIRWRDANGDTHETLSQTPTFGLSGTTIALYPDRPAKITWTAPGAQAFVYTLLGYGVYRSRNGVYGWVGDADAGAISFNDDGSAPDYGTQPPRGTNPFLVGGGTNSYPAALTYHEQRLIYAGLGNKPQAFTGSWIGKEDRFDINTPVQDSDTFEFKPASERLEDIRHMLSLRHLLLFTGGGVWNCYGPSGAISTSSVILRRANRLGASYLRPLAIDLSALYYTARGRVRDLAWDWRTDNYNGHDVSQIARHLLDRRALVDWAYAETPYSIIWAVRDDGTMLSMTYAAGGAEAWARHATAGVYERVASVVEPDPNTGAFEDAVYTVVKRVVNGATVRYIERFSSRLLPQKHVTNLDGTLTYSNDVRLANFLDASLQYDGRNLVQAVTLADGSGGVAPFVGGSLVNITAAANPIVVPGGANRGFQAGDVGRTIVLDQDGAAYEVVIVAVAGALAATGQLSQNLPVQYQGVAVSGGLGAAVLTGLGHLEGAQVTVLLDGGVLADPLTVVGGQVALPEPGLIAQVGLSYNSDFELLDVGADQAKTNEKSVRKLTLEVTDSRGVYAGQSFDDADLRLYTPKQQSVGDVASGSAVPPLKTGNIEVVLASSWTQQARACVRQSDPLPLTVLAAVREVVVGGR